MSRTVAKDSAFTLEETVDLLARHSSVSKYQFLALIRLILEQNQTISIDLNVAHCLQEMGS